MNQYLILCKFLKYKYLAGSKVDKEWTLIIVNAKSKIVALKKLKAKVEYFGVCGDSKLLQEYKLI